MCLCFACRKHLPYRHPLRVIPLRMHTRVFTPPSPHMRVCRRVPILSSRAVRLLGGSAATTPRVLRLNRHGMLSVRTSPRSGLPSTLILSNIPRYADVAYSYFVRISLQYLVFAIHWSLKPPSLIDDVVVFCVVPSPPTISHPSFTTPSLPLTLSRPTSPRACCASHYAHIRI